MVISVLQLARYSTEGLLQLGPLGSTTFLPDTKCLVDDGRGRTPRLKKCEGVSRISQRLWDFTQVTSPLKFPNECLYLVTINPMSTCNYSLTLIHHLISSAVQQSHDQK